MQFLALAGSVCRRFVGVKVGVLRGIPQICTWGFLTISAHIARGEKVKPHPLLYEILPIVRLVHAITVVALAD